VEACKATTRYKAPKSQKKNPMPTIPQQKSQFQKSEKFRIPKFQTISSSEIPKRSEIPKNSEFQKFKKIRIPKFRKLLLKIPTF
jgi:hypothetical protein